MIYLQPQRELVAELGQKPQAPSKTTYFWAFPCPQPAFQAASLFCPHNVLGRKWVKCR